MFNYVKRELKYHPHRTLFFLAVCMVFIPSMAFAKDNLTEIFTTKAFQGSWEVINKFQVIGWLLNMIISVCCFIGLVLTVVSVVTSFLYLSNKNLWNQVHAVKTSTSGSKFFGMPELLQRTIAAESGSGLDAFVTFFLGLLPDIYTICDYGGGNTGKLDENSDNAFNYFLKTGIEKLVMIFFLAIGFSGTLWQLYGTVVDGMIVIADNIVAVELDKQVQRIINMGGSYNFTIDSAGTAESEMQQRVAQLAYQEVLGKTDLDLDDIAKNSLGGDLTSAVMENVTADAISKYLYPNGGTASDSDIKSVQMKVSLTDRSVDMENRGVCFAVPSGYMNNETYIAVTFTGVKTYGDYFNRSTSGSKSSSSGSKSSKSSKSNTNKSNKNLGNTLSN